MPSRDQLLRILAVGHDTTMRGKGLSLRDALRESNYRELRPQFDVSALIPLIREQPELVTQWIMYSEDKRTDCGFAATDTSAEAIAEYVLRELDFWDSIQ